MGPFNNMTSVVNSVLCQYVVFYIGWLIDISGSYSSPFLVFGLVQILGGVCGILIFYFGRQIRQ